MTIQFIIKSFESQNMSKALQIFQVLFGKFHTSFSRYPTHIKRWTVLSSPHVHKKSREQFEIRTHKAQISIQNIDNAKGGQILQSIKKIQLKGVQLQLKLSDRSNLY